MYILTDMYELGLLLKDVDIVHIVLAAVAAFAISVATHYYNAQQKLRVHHKSEIFERKQKMYRQFLQHFPEKVPLTRIPIYDKGNWKIGDYFYNELLSLASTDVMKAYHKYLSIQDKPKVDDIEYDNASKDLLITIRKDLTGEIISRDDIVYFAPPEEISVAYRFIRANYSILQPYDLTNLKNFAQINIDKISSETVLDTSKLRQIKDIAEEEIKRDGEFREFLQQIKCN